MARMTAAAAAVAVLEREGVTTSFGVPGAAINPVFAELVDGPVVPTLMGWGTIPDDHRLWAGMVGLQTSHRYGNATFLRSDFVLGIGNRWANRHTGGLEVYRSGRKF